jgi:MoxR-like ATPase
MSYKKIFAPEAVETAPALVSGLGDQREGSVYVYTEQIVLAVNVALATGRPLLVRGPSLGGGTPSS